MSDIVEVLNEIVERHDCSHPAIVSKASVEITRLTADNEKLRAALEEIIQDSFSVYAIQVARAALEGKQ